MKISELAFLKHLLFYQLLPFLKFEPPPVLGKLRILKSPLSFLPNFLQHL